MEYGKGNWAMQPSCGCRCTYNSCCVSRLTIIHKSLVYWQMLYYLQVILTVDSFYSGINSVWIIHWNWRIISMTFMQNLWKWTFFWSLWYVWLAIPQSYLWISWSYWKCKDSHPVIMVFRKTGSSSAVPTKSLQAFIPSFSSSCTVWGTNFI